MPSNRFAQEQEQKRVIREAREQQFKAEQHQLRRKTSAIKVQSMHRGNVARLLVSELRRPLRPEEILEQRRQAWSSERAAMRKPGYVAGMLPPKLVERERKRVWSERAMRSAEAAYSAILQSEARSPSMGGFEAACQRLLVAKWTSAVAKSVEAESPGESQVTSSRTRSSARLKSLSRRHRQLSMAHSPETPKASGGLEQALASSTISTDSPPTQSRRARIRSISKELMGAAVDAVKTMLSA